MTCHIGFKAKTVINFEINLIKYFRNFFIQNFYETSYVSDPIIESMTEGQII